MSRSDSIKVALRLATKAKPEELARLYRQVKAEDKRFRAEEPMNNCHLKDWDGTPGFSKIFQRPSKTSLPSVG